MDLYENCSEHFLIQAQLIASFWYGKPVNSSLLVQLTQVRHLLGKVSPLESAIAYSLSGDSPVEKL